MKNLVLKAVRQDGTTHGGFVWLYEVGAVVTAPDWQPTYECGNGLHGWLRGEGDLSACDYYQDAKWLVCEPIGPVFDLGGKVKFESAKIVFVGSKDACDDYLRKECDENLRIVYSVERGGDHATQTAGDNAYQTARDWANQTAGYKATQTAGNNATQTAGINSNLSAYNNSKFKAGKGSVFAGRWYKNDKWNVAVAIIGDGGLKPDTWYLFKDGNFTEIENE